jgi:hypothetical protein
VQNWINVVGDCAVIKKKKRLARDSFFFLKKKILKLEKSNMKGK